MILMSYMKLSSSDQDTVALMQTQTLFQCYMPSNSKQWNQVQGQIITAISCPLGS